VPVHVYLAWVLACFIMVMPSSVYSQTDPVENSHVIVVRVDCHARVLCNYWIFFLAAGGRAAGPGGLRSKTALDDGPPKRDNSQGL
jgi:hypothetical protein